MTGKELLNKLNTYSNEQLEKDIHICGSDCMINNMYDIHIAQEEYTDKDGYTIYEGELVIEW